MTEMTGKIYPVLHDIRESPSAPPEIEMKEVDQGHSYRLQYITDIQNFLENEISVRENFCKKYFRVSRIINSVDSILITVSLGTGLTGAVLLSTVVAAPVVVGLEVTAGVIGLFSLIGNVVSKKTSIKGEKHLKIKRLASSKFDTIKTHVSKALADNYVSNEEFNLIMDELNKYKVMKEEIRKNTKTKIKKEEEEGLIERGR